MAAALFHCDLAAAPRPLPHFWEHTIGSGHARLALRADYQAQLARCHRELGFRHVRFHGVLSEGMGTLICHDNRLLYSFLNADRVYDFLVSIGMGPLVELSFMPAAIAADGKTVMNYRDIVGPPQDMREWTTLVTRLVRHWIDRYGAETVRTWPFEVWNEPNLPAFWPADQAAYFALYAATAQALKEVDADLRVGGPATAMNAWVPEFLSYCRDHDVPVDFVSTHYYPTDALGKEGMNTLEELAYSRRGVMREKAEETRRAAGDLPVYYTEWSSSSDSHDPLHDRPYAAAFAAKTILDNVGLVEGYSWWTFSDIFAENYMESEPYYGGFGLLNLYNIPKPTYRAFGLLHDLGDTLFPVQGTHPTVDAYVTRGPEGVTVLLTNHALPRHPIATERAEVTLTRLGEQPSPAVAYVRRVDDDHANPRRVWETLGCPEYLSQAEAAMLEQTSACVAEPLPVSHAGETVSFTVEVPPHGIAAVTLPEREGKGGTTGR